jgi:excinuclease ABC subunit C
MERLAMELDFEQAHQIKEKLTAFEDYQAKSTVVSTKIQDVDVFSIASEEEEKEAYINYIKIVNGAIIHTHTQELIKNLDDEEQELLEYAIPIIRERFNSIAREIILPYELQLEDGLQAIIPKIGDKKKLLELSQKNARFFMLQRKKQRISHQNKQTSAERILRTLQSDLNMDQLPLHVECFDNSNIQGSHPVASCVVFKNAKPSKKDYRHFNIKTVVGPDDYASMEEVVYRRYRRLLAEKQALPQLVIIDGGKGQLSAAVKSIEKLGLTDQITVIGIAKRLEEIFFPGDAIPLYIDKKSESLKLIQQARNEAHRFAITFHRNQRSRNFTSTVLTKIPGVGHKTAQKLLAHFGSVKKIRQASIIDLSEVVGLGAAKKVNAFFSSAEEE